MEKTIMKKTKRLLLLLLCALLLLSLAGCKRDEPAEPSPTPTATPTVTEPITENEEDILLPPVSILG